jgi:hypothetical protein
VTYAGQCGNCITGACGTCDLTTTCNSPSVDASCAFVTTGAAAGVKLPSPSPGACTITGVTTNGSAAPAGASTICCQ